MTAGRSGFITVGHDVRHWTTYSVSDLTPEEYAVLTDGEEDPGAIALLRRLSEAGRLQELEDNSDDTPTAFEDVDHPSVIAVGIAGEEG
jgi:hypothetical protein